MIAVCSFILLIGLGLFIACIVLSALHCNAGFWGYPDIWSNESVEKLYYILFPVSFFMIVVSGCLLYLC